MRSSSIPTSLIFLAGAALCIGACNSQPQTEPSGSTPGSATTTNTMASTMAGSAPTAVGAAGIASTTGTAGSIGIASAGHSAAGATTAATAGTGTSAAGASATGAAGMATASAAGTGAATSAAGMGGAAGAAGSGNAGGPTFTRVHDEILVGAGCAAPGACHGSAQGPSKLGFTDKMTAYMDLVGVKAMGMALPTDKTTKGCAGMDIERVKPGDPDNSLLMQKLEGKQTCGNQMPPGGMIKAEQLQLVRDWIMAGAKND